MYYDLPQMRLNNKKVCYNAVSLNGILGSSLSCRASGALYDELATAVDGDPYPLGEIDTRTFFNESLGE
jgi:hypothetical protein